MSLLGINMLNVSITAIAVIYVFVCLLMVLLVLMQRPKQEGLGAAFGASTTDQLFGARTTNVLQKGTVYLSVLFFVLTFTLAILVQKRNHEKFKSLAGAEAPTTDTITVTPGETTVTQDVPTPATTVPVEAPPAQNDPTTVEKPADGVAPEAPPATGTPEQSAPPQAPADADKTPQ